MKRSKYIIAQICLVLMGYQASWASTELPDFCFAHQIAVSKGNTSVIGGKLNPFPGHIVVETPNSTGETYTNYSDKSQWTRSLDAIAVGKLTQPALVYETDGKGILRLRQIVVDRTGENGAERQQITDFNSVVRVANKGGERYLFGEEARAAQSSLGPDDILLRWNSQTESWRQDFLMDKPASGRVIIETAGKKGNRQFKTYTSVEEFEESTKLGSLKEPAIVHTLNTDGKLIASEFIVDRKRPKTEGSKGNVYRRQKSSHMDVLLRVSRPDGAHRLYVDDKAIDNEVDMGAFKDQKGLAYRLVNGQWTSAFSLEDVRTLPDKEEAVDTTGLARQRIAPGEDGKKGKKMRNAAIATGTASTLHLIGVAIMAAFKTTLPPGQQDPVILDITMAMGGGGGDDGTEGILMEVVPLDEQMNKEESELSQREKLAKMAEEENKKAITEVAKVEPKVISETGTLPVAQPEPIPPTQAQPVAQTSDPMGTESEHQDGDPNATTNGGSAPTSREEILRSAGSGGGSGGGTGGGNGTGAGAGSGPAFFGISTKTHERIVFLVDSSGSMADEHSMDALKVELSNAIRNLPDKCGFNILPFDDRCVAWRPDIIKVSKHAKEMGVKFVKTMNPGAGTNFNAAFEEALLHKPDVIFFLTDGQGDLYDDTFDKTNGIVIHTIAFGNGANRGLMQEIAKKRNGQFVKID